MIHSQFFAPVNTTHDWIEMFTDAGCDKKAIKEVLSKDLIKNIDYLYARFINLPQSMRKDFHYSWQILCFSGETQALEYAIKVLGVNNRTMNCWGENCLHYAALSGSVAQLKLALTMEIPWNTPSFSQANILHYSALSGSMDQLFFVNTFTHVKTLPITTRKGRNHLHYAAYSGDLDTVQFASSINKVDIKATDVYGYNALNYAKAKGNKPVIEWLEQIGLKLQPNQENFYFGEEPRQELNTAYVMNGL